MKSKQTEVSAQGEWRENLLIQTLPKGKRRSAGFWTLTRGPYMWKVAEMFPSMPEEGSYHSNPSHSVVFHGIGYTGHYYSFTAFSYERE